MTTLEEVRRLPGLDSYLEQVESRLAAAVSAYSGRVAKVGSDALASGGKRLRPLLAFLSAPPDGPAPVAAGVAVELVHMATLVHDDLIDGASVRRGKAAAWAAHGPDAARATGDYLFSRAFAELAADGDVRPVAVLAEASLCLARGEAMQRRQRNDPDTPVAAYLERCALKTGKLFEAACSLGSGGALGRFGLNLGIAFQIADDILDCSGDTIETGKVAGTDLREGTPTLPLLLAAREDEAVRDALAGGPIEGALLRVAATGALERSREVALDYAREARESLNGGLHREELESSRTPSSTESANGYSRPSIHARTDLGEGRRRRAARLRGRPRAARDRRPARPRRARRPGAPAARRHRRGLLRPEPLLEPDERLPREVQVLRLRRDAEAGAGLHDLDPGDGRGRGAPARADRVHRDPHGQRREPARRLRVLRRRASARSSRRSRTCT